MAVKKLGTAQHTQLKGGCQVCISAVPCEESADSKRPLQQRSDRARHHQWYRIFTRAPNIIGGATEHVSNP